MKQQCTIHRLDFYAQSGQWRVVRHLGLISVLAITLATSCKNKLGHSSQADAGHPLPGISSEQVDAINNESKQPLYVGPTGTIEGTITISGDAAPDMTPFIDAIPANCAKAQELYGKLFREGPGRVVADALVAVTNFHGYVKPKSNHVDLSARDCGWQQRTIALTYGQRIDVKSADSQPYIPQLLGAPTGALLVAIPNGEAVPVLAREPGHYVLIDSMRLFSKADVFVVRYPTTDVTGLDGHYRITGIPTGPATLSALLPSTSSTATKSVTIEASKAVHVDLTLAFDQSTFRPRGKTSTAATSQGSPAPSQAAP